MSGLRSRLTSLVDPAVSEFLIQLCEAPSASQHHDPARTQHTVSCQLFHLLRVDDEAKLKALQEVSDSFDVSMCTMECY